MARTKKIEEPQAQAQEQEQEQEAPAPVPQAPEVKRIPDGFTLPPDGKLVPIKCTVPGFEHITVHFKTSNAWKLIHEADSIPNEDGWRVARQVMLRARRFEGWNFVDEVTLEPVQAPTPGDLDTYKPLVLTRSDYLPLGIWCLGEGYNAAMESLTKN